MKAGRHLSQASYPEGESEQMPEESYGLYSAKRRGVRDTSFVYPMAKVAEW